MSTVLDDEWQAVSVGPFDLGNKAIQVSAVMNLGCSTEQLTMIGTSDSVPGMTTNWIFGGAYVS
jgi:hypothetical protein